MKQVLAIERITAARQRLAELSRLGRDQPQLETQLAETGLLLSNLLDDLETVANDMTDQLAIADEQQHRFNILAETATDGIISIDEQSNIQYVNPGAEQMFGYEADELLGKNLTSLIPERFRQIHLTSIRRYLDTGQRRIAWKAVELPGLHQGGWEFPIEISFGEDIRDGRHFFTGIVRDITERKRGEEALKQAQDKVRSIQAELAHITRVMAMGEITGSIAHEINQPLGAIVNYGSAALRLLSTGPVDLGDIRTVLSAIVDDANRASAVIARVRALSKNTPPEMEVLQVSDVVAEILPLVEPELARRQVALKTVFPEDLSPVRGDRIQLQQVLLNLMINGIEAMRQVSEDRRLLFIQAQPEVSLDKSFVVVSVTDYGIGVKADDLPKLFELFYTTKSEGMGLGLAISRSIVEAHGGRLWATPDVESGATFQFSLPVETLAGEDLG